MRKNPMILCSCESEDHEDGVGTGVNGITMSGVIY